MPIANYCPGAAVNEFVEYQSWADLGPYLSAADFAAWYLATAQHITPFLTVPAVLLSGVLVLLCSGPRPCPGPRCGWPWLATRYSGLLPYSCSGP